MNVKLTDVVLVIGALAALFASWQSYQNGQQLAALSGQVGANERLLSDHVNTAHVFVSPTDFNIVRGVVEQPGDANPPPEPPGGF